MSSSSLSAPSGSTKMGSLSSVKRQHLLTEFAGLKQACPQGIYVSLTQGDPTLWSGVLFVRRGPYAPAILRFHISFPDTYPSLPPLVTFSTDMFHPLLTPLTTYMYSTDVQDGGTASAFDEERLPPGGFSLRHGFAGWFGRGGRAAGGAAGSGVAVGGGSGSGGGSAREERGVGLGLGLGGSSTVTRSENAEEEMMLRTPTRPVATATGTTPVSVAASATSAASAAGASVASSSASMPGYARPGRPKEVSTYEVLRYIRSAFDDEDVLDAVPLEAAGNPGAWHAWRTHRRQQQTAGTGKPLPVPGSGSASASASAVESGARARISAGSAPSGTGAEPEDQPGKAPTATAGASASGTTRSGGGGIQTGAETPARRPNEWNWEGVWEERVKRGVAASLSEGVLFGHAGTADEVINFLSMDDAEIEGAKSNLLRTLGAAA
ncbi:hypothetical protein B0J18DRAFT_418514 [Chaetomium sp. MPI-SDFR-AT-0129]|nr:hypothetical protein B0J18DRAFT_418514 [Chaetomium sp. MPI-SDFR-AT-0129]